MGSDEYAWLAVVFLLVLLGLSQALHAWVGHA